MAVRVVGRVLFDAGGPDREIVVPVVASARRDLVGELAEVIHEAALRLVDHDRAGRVRRVHDDGAVPTSLW